MSNQAQAGLSRNGGALAIRDLGSLPMPQQGGLDDFDLVQQAALQTVVRLPQAAVLMGSQLQVEVRPSRGSNPDAPGTWRARIKGRWVSLGLDGTQPRQDAQRVAYLKWAHEEAKRRGIVAPKDTPLAVVAEYFLDQRHPGNFASPRDYDTYAKYERSIRRLLTFFRPKTLGEISHKACVKYLDDAETFRDRRFSPDSDGPTLSRATCHIDLVTMRMAVRLYEADMHLGWSPTIRLPPAPTARKGFFTRDDAARILWACRGRIFDRATGTWKVQPVIDKVTGATSFRRVLRDPVEVLRREAIRRYVFLGLYSGTRQDVVIGLSWKLHPDRGCLDPTGGFIHRAGFAAPEKEGKPRMTSALQAVLLLHARAWRRKDVAAGIWHVFHKPRGEKRGKPYTYFPYNIWWNVMSDAGLNEHSDPHVLCHTACTWMGMNGYDLFITADVTGRDPDTVRKTYRQWNLTSQIHAVTIGRLSVRKGIEVEDFATNDRPRSSVRYTPRGRTGRHKPPLPRR